MKTLTAVLAIAVATGTAAAERVELMAEAAARSNAGDHGAAVALYEQAYLESQDPTLLPILGSEYRRAGLPLDAIDRFCTYLTVQPRGAQVVYSAMQVRAIRSDLGQRTTGDVCVEPAPLRIDFVTPKRRPEPSRVMSRREIAGIATAALGLGSLAAALYYHGQASAISDQIASHAPNQPWPDDIRDLERRGQRYEDRQQWFAIAGGAALVTAGVLYFTGRADRLSPESVVVAPTVTSSGGGISLSRGF